ncbi:restriction endonuclease subunit S [Clostridium perfringens]
MQNKHLNGRGELVVSSGNTNRGIIGNTDINAKIIKKNSITIDMFGNVYARDYPYKMVTHARVFSLIPKEEMSVRVLNYIASNLDYLPSVYSYSNMATFDKIKGIKITLPVLNEKINFLYIEKFIEELETSYIEKLKVYLLSKGLTDYRLTKYDEEIIDRFNKLSDNNLSRKIKLEDILEWQVGIKEIDPLKISLLYQEGMKYPFYGQATENNGIISHISLGKELLNNKNSKPTILIHSNNQNIVYLETPFYLKDGHGATSVLQNKNMNYKIALYFMSAIKRVIEERFNYNSKATKIGLKNTVIELPICNKGIDYKFMEDFITAVLKLIIKDVVIWIDKKINYPNKVLNKNLGYKN